jgi:hypothetical protein
MFIHGEAQSGIHRVKYFCGLENGTWRIETRDPYQKVREVEVTSPSPWSDLDRMLSEAFAALKSRIPDRAPHPALKARVQVERPSTKSLRLGPRRAEPTTTGDTAHE